MGRAVPGPAQGGAHGTGKELRLAVVFRSAHEPGGCHHRLPDRIREIAGAGSLSGQEISQASRPVAPLRDARGVREVAHLGRRSHAGEEIAWTPRPLLISGSWRGGNAGSPRMPRLTG